MHVTHPRWLAELCRRKKMERVNGVAPLSQPWRGRILLLNYTRRNEQSDGMLALMGQSDRPSAHARPTIHMHSDAKIARKCPRNCALDFRSFHRKLRPRKMHFRRIKDVIASPLDRFANLVEIG